MLAGGGDVPGTESHDRTKLNVKTTSSLLCEYNFHKFSFRHRNLDQNELHDSINKILARIEFHGNYLSNFNYLFQISQIEQKN